MSFNFSETVTITVPDVEDQLAAFGESDYSKNHGLIIEVAAIHEGMTANFNYYSAETLEEALSSWVTPYPKPIILNHDVETEPIGRVMAATMAKEDDGTPYTKLQVAVLDPSAISKVTDKRYLTGSVGGRAQEALCSVCKADWAKASMFEAPCNHRRGKAYKGKMAFLELGGLTFKEYSFVNVPADSRSTVRTVGASVGAAEAEEDWARPVRLFSLDMSDEKIVELSESEDRDVLSGMRKKESMPIYMQLKGAFLSTLAVTESDDFNKESDVDETTLLEGDEDILAIADDLSADLAAEHDPEDEDPTPAADDEVSDDEDGEQDEPVTAEPAEEPTDTADETPTDDDEDEDAEVTDAAPEGQERPHDDETPLPPSRESEENATETTVSETDLNEAVRTLESRVNELEAREQSLLSENTKLKTALKRSLAERVVDTKIALGLHEQSAREQLMEDHVKRSASSLADSLRDLAAMPFPKVTNELTDIPTLTEGGSAIGDGTDNAVTEGEPQSKDDLDPEEVLVDAFMGRRTL